MNICQEGSIRYVDVRFYVGVRNLCKLYSTWLNICKIGQIRNLRSVYYYFFFLCVEYDYYILIFINFLIFVFFSEL